MTVEGKTQEEMDDDTASREAKVRKRRDALLAETDWMVIKALESGESLSAEWATYRQALRDITDHANFPDLAEADMEGNGSDWPTKPE